MEYLRNMLAGRARPEVSQLVKIDKRALRQVMKLVKSGKSSGADFIDG